MTSLSVKMPVARIGAARRLPQTAVPKPWGRRDTGIWGAALAAADMTVGEIIHQGDADAPLLLKTLFTSAPLSVQVHPGGAGARAVGRRCGKDEAWLVLSAQPDAVVGLGLKAPASRDRVAAAAADGSIADLLWWHPARAGDVFHVPAGTIHAVGAGLTLFEVQQNCDITYRLWDHGRPRPLQVEQALDVAEFGRWRHHVHGRSAGRERTPLIACDSFVMERLDTRGGLFDPPSGHTVWAAVIAGQGSIDGMAFAPGDVWQLDGPARLAGTASLVLAHDGPDPLRGLWTPTPA